MEKWSKLVKELLYKVETKNDLGAKGMQVGRDHIYFGERES